MGVRPILWLALVTTGCLPQPEVSVPYPDDAQSAVIQARDGHRTHLRILPVQSDTLALPFIADSDAEVDVSVLFLRIPASDLPTDPEPADNRPFVVFDPDDVIDVFGGTLANGEFDQWSKPDRAQILSDVRIYDPTDLLKPCTAATTYWGDWVPFDEVFEPAAIFGSGSDLAYAVDGNGVIYSIHEGGDIMSSGTSFPSPPLLAYSRGEHEHWVGHTDGRVTRFSSDTWVTDTLTTVSSSTITGIDGSPSSEPLELFIVDVLGTFARFDGQEWTSLWSGFEDVPDTLSVVARIGPGHAIAAGKRNRIYRYRDGRLTEESFDWASLAVVASAAAHHPALGTLLAATDADLEAAPEDLRPFESRLFRHHRRWRELEEPMGGTVVWDFALEADRVLAAGGGISVNDLNHPFGFLAEVGADGLCETGRRGARNTRQMVPIGDSVLLLAFPEVVSHSRLNLVSPR